MIRGIIQLYLILAFIVALVVTLLYLMGVVTDLPNGLGGVWAFWFVPWLIMWFITLVNSPKTRYDWGSDITRKQWERW